MALEDAAPYLKSEDFRVYPMSDDVREVESHPVDERIATALERIADALEKQVAAASFLDDALQPSNDETRLTLENLDFYRTTDGRFMVRTSQGDREPTPAEEALLRTTVRSWDRWG